jgi:glutamine amidotransferase
MNSALLKAVPIIKKRTGYIKAMNIVIADKESIYLSTLFNERPSYFTMHHKRINGDLMVCSEPYPGEEGWLKVKNDTIMELK